MRITWLVATMLLLSVCLFAVDNDGAMYVGGTITAKVPEKTEGKLDLSQEAHAKFVWKKGEALIPYDKIDSIEYGQKAGRRVGVAVMVSPIALFSKKRKHYLTLGFNDAAGKQQGIVLELGKDTVRQTLSVFEARTSKKVEYESEEAKKHVGN
jgi:hypothetical protein